MTRLFEDILWQSSQHLFEGIGRALLAVSGGADSVAMVHALHRLAQEGRLSCGFVIGHVNHCLRGSQSDADEAFVKALDDSLDISVVTKAVDVRAYAQDHKLSIETAGRVVRLKTLATMATGYDCDCIVTAHHKDDLAETMIHRLMRGTGFRGLCGIWPASEVYGAEFIRPMLGLRRIEIIQYCTDNKFSWREDVSNHDINFTRNRIRHHLLPALQGESNAVIDRLSALSHSSRRFLLRTEKHAQSILAKGRLDTTKKEFALGQDLLEDCPPWVFYEVIRGALVKLGIGLRNYKKEHFDVIRQLIDMKKAKAEFPGLIEILVDNKTVFVQAKKEPTVLSRESVTLQIGRTVQFGPWKIYSKVLNRNDVDIKHFLKTKDTFVEWFDADTITGPIEVRDRRDGDRFGPIGAKGEKKVGRFLMDTGLPPQAKKQAFVVKDTKKILWLAPFRMSERAKVTKQTTQILEIRIDS